jgi:hypothetical protein
MSRIVPGTSSGAKPTRLATVYERPIKSQAAREWMASHPRIVVPILVFLLGTLSYVVRSISSSCRSVILIASAKSDIRSYSDSCCAGQGNELVGLRR